MSKLFEAQLFGCKNVGYKAEVYHGARLVWMTEWCATSSEVANEVNKFLTEHCGEYKLRWQDLTE